MHGYFYNSSIRQYIILMGDLFSKIVVTREKEDGIVYQKVPISNATRENFIKSLDRINNSSMPQNKAKVETVLPRMNITMVDILYDPTKKTSMLKNTSKEYQHPSQYNPVPYKFMFEVGIYTRYLKDMYQIIEQIVPYFQPHFTTQITELHTNEVKIKRDINIALQGVSLDESSDGAINDRRHIEWSIMFELTGWIYPPSVNIENQIRTIYLDFFGDTQEAADKFESIDYQVNPLDVDKEDWNGDYNESQTEDIKIPQESPSKIRG